MVLQNGTFLGKVLLNNMIPVPLSQIQEISLNKHARFSNQEDSNYGLLLIKEARWIDEHKDSIVKRQIGFIDTKSMKRIGLIGPEEKYLDF